MVKFGSIFKFQTCWHDDDVYEVMCDRSISLETWFRNPNALVTITMLFLFIKPLTAAVVLLLRRIRRTVAYYFRGLFKFLVRMYLRLLFQSNLNLQMFIGNAGGKIVKQPICRRRCIILGKLWEFWNSFRATVADCTQSFFLRRVPWPAVGGLIFFL